MAEKKSAPKAVTSESSGSAKKATKSVRASSAPRSDNRKGAAAAKMMSPTSRSQVVRDSRGRFIDARKSDSRNGGVQKTAKGSGQRTGGVDVFVRDFEPAKGIAVLEFGGQKVRYRSERSQEQVFAIADYLRARRGFSTDQEMADVLGVHRTRLAAWKQGTDIPNPENAQLLAHIAVVVHQLREFLDPDVIPDWLLTEQYTLNGRTPVEALRQGQLAEVLQSANATEHGAFV